MTTSIRSYRPQDLGRVLQLWEQTGSVPKGPDGLEVDEAIELLGSNDAVALVAEAGDAMVGMALGVASPVVAWVYRISMLDEGQSTPDVMRPLFDELEMRLADRGARRLIALAADAEVRKELERRDYRAAHGVACLEREVPASAAPPSDLEDLGGQLIHSGLWEELKGMDEPKEIIERRVILPLAQPELAVRHAVAPPRAIVLFGPPGTGKTTFAKGIASVLGWPFIEVHPAELAGDSDKHEASLLANTFDRALRLDTGVVFVDEVEDLASVRDEERKVSPTVTNEFLKQIPRFRVAARHLLVCATNWIGRLDSAFLRPGRFDYVLPVGPPDAGARAAIWQRYVEEITDEDIDVAALVEATTEFTPADIEFTARKAAQRAFEREHFERSDQRATTDDFLIAVENTRPTLTEQTIRSFQEDMKDFARF